MSGPEILAWLVVGYVIVVLMVFFGLCSAAARDADDPGHGEDRPPFRRHL